MSAELDALAELRERARVEEQAERYMRAPYLEPFVLRALGRVREDEDLVRRAVDRFESLGLGRHAEQTRRLLD